MMTLIPHFLPSQANITLTTLPTKLSMQGSGVYYLMIKYVDSFCGYLQSVPGPENIAKWYNYLTYDVMGGKIPRDRPVSDRADMRIS